MRRHVVLIALALAACRTACADCFVVVNVASSVHEVTARQVTDILMGRTAALPDGDYAAPFDLRVDNPVRDHFYLALTGLTPPEINSYRARLTFSGRWRPPPSVASEEAMEAAISQQRGAIGYLSARPTRPSLRIVLTLEGGC